MKFNNLKNNIIRLYLRVNKSDLKMIGICWYQVKDMPPDLEVQHSCNLAPCFT